jgi:hypothetical protein
MPIVLLGGHAAKHSSTYLKNLALIRSPHHSLNTVAGQTSRFLMQLSPNFIAHVMT